ncbi:GNAT family N-acetyltransferase, partial [Streptomyces sp. SID9727]|nr:GNAT family N-acetyltransferase [Streptomyces sp. SID9727]
MTIALGTPDTDGLAAAAEALRSWQAEGAPMQLHPGDLGWYGRHGSRAVAAAVRTWSRAGRILAVGLLDGPGLVRLTTAPDARGDEALARRLADDLSDPAHGVLPTGRAAVEAPRDALVREVLGERGWGIDEPWTPLRRDLAGPVPAPVPAVEVA